MSSVMNAMYAGSDQCTPVQSHTGEEANRMHHDAMQNSDRDGLPEIFQKIQIKDVVGVVVRVWREEW